MLDLPAAGATTSLPPPQPAGSLAVIPAAHTHHCLSEWTHFVRRGQRPCVAAAATVARPFFPTERAPAAPLNAGFSPPRPICTLGNGRGGLRARQLQYRLLVPAPFAKWGFMGAGAAHALCGLPAASTAARIGESKRGSTVTPSCPAHC